MKNIKMILYLIKTTKDIDTINRLENKFNDLYNKFVKYYNANVILRYSSSNLFLPS